MPKFAEELLHRHKYSVVEYHRLGEAGVLRADERVELIEGEIIDRAPIGSRHAAVVKRLIQILTRAVGDRAIVSAQDPVAIENHSEPQPDLALLLPRTDFYAAAHPGAQDVLLIIEVADSSLRYDREVKIPLYARSKIPEIWLVDLENKTLTLYQQAKGESYAQILVAANLGSITLPGMTDANVDVSMIF